MPAVRIEPSSARSKSGALATTPRELYIIAIKNYIYIMYTVNKLLHYLRIE